MYVRPTDGRPQCIGIGLSRNIYMIPFVVVTTLFQWHIAFTALALGCFAPSGLMQ